jgi:isopentenyl diphosphate isomerase/L-lactate dehydrogenase-like FMN-dependent dehydrogenase
MGVVKAAGSTPIMFDSGVRDARCRHRAGVGATAKPGRRPFVHALSYGGSESLTHYLKSSRRIRSTLAICGFKDIATLKKLAANTRSPFVR